MFCPSDHLLRHDLNIEKNLSTDRNNVTQYEVMWGRDLQALQTTLGVDTVEHVGLSTCDFINIRGNVCKC